MDGMPLIIHTLAESAQASISKALRAFEELEDALGISADFSEYRSKQANKGGGS